MATFEYEAIDASGKSKNGVVSADTARRARAELRRLNLTPVSIATAKERSQAKETSARDSARINNRQLVSVTRQISVLLDAGAPLEQALQAIALQSETRRVRTRLLAVRERVMEGWRFADALGEDKKSFSELYRSIVAAGETSGDLAPVLDRLAGMLEKSRAIQSKAIGALVYPLALAVFAGAVITGLMVLVVPRIIEQFAVFDAQLPLITRIVVGVSNFVGAYGFFIVLAIVAGTVGFWQAMRVPGFRYEVDRRLLATPLIGPLLRSLEGARFSRTLSTLTAGGAPLLTALDGAGKTVVNTFMRSKLADAADQVREGTTLASALKRANVLPPMMVHMTSAGETAGELPKMLDKSADQLEEEFDTVTTVTLRLLEPIIIFVMGGVVAAIVAAIMLPMLQLNALVSGG